MRGLRMVVGRSNHWGSFTRDDVLNREREYILRDCLPGSSFFAEKVIGEEVEFMCSTRMPPFKQLRAQRVA